MVYYRCKCGNHEAWTSMGVNPCCKCLKCGSNLATSPGSHEDPKPHDFRPTKVETNEGTSYLDRCFWCTKTRKQVEEEEQRAKDKNEAGA